MPLESNIKGIPDNSYLELKERLKRLWQNTCILNMKNKGCLKYSLIPEDLLIRTFNENKNVYDILNWMMVSPLVPKLKMNQILIHLGALLL